MLVFNSFVIQDLLKFSFSRSAFVTYIISNACLESVKLSFAVSNVIFFPSYFDSLVSDTSNKEYKMPSWPNEAAKLLLS